MTPCESSEERNVPQDVAEKEQTFYGTADTEMNTERKGFTKVEEAVCDELEEDDREVVRDLFDELDLDNSGSISTGEFFAAIKRFVQPHEKDLADALKAMMEHTKSTAVDVSFQEFYARVKELPRVRGQRVQWARTLRLDRQLARHLKKGDFFDGVKGLREMTDAEVQRACADFSTHLCILLNMELEKLRGQVHVDAEQYKNTKFSMDGTEFEGSFAALEDFYSGPEKFIGTPNPNAEEGLKREHCDRKNANHTYRSPNYNFEFTPSLEFEFVMSPNMNYQYAHTPRDNNLWPPEKRGEWKGEHGREIKSIDEFMRLPFVKTVKLQRPEVASLRMYTGPAYILYNAVMRKYPIDVLETLQGNKYETTIFCIMSGVTKLSRVARIPASRCVFRGLGGMILPEEFWRVKRDGFRGGIEWGLMSTTTNKRVAMQYSGLDKQRGTVFEISVGRVDMGADLSWLSQYPGEEEILFPPLTCLEVVGQPRVEDGVVVFPLRANMNLKGLTLEQLVERRKQLHLSMARNLAEELFIEASKAASAGVKVDSLIRVIVCSLECRDLIFLSIMNIGHSFHFIDRLLCVQILQT